MPRRTLHGLLALISLGIIIVSTGYSTGILRAQQDAATPAATAIPTATWTPFVVTASPTPRNVFIAAALVLEQTAQAEAVGTATSTPINVVTATHTPTLQVVTNTPTPANEATATLLARHATAVALTTGTVDPARLATATDTPGATATRTPAPKATARAKATATPKPAKPTATHTPVFLLLSEMTPTATPEPRPTLVFPEPLMDRILFLSDMRDGKVRVYSMKADGTELAQLTNGWPYTRAEERDAYTADRSLRAFALREEQFGTRGKIQLFYNFYEYETVPQLTFFGAGTAWAPAWSPTEQKVAFVSNESRNDEIWVVERDQWPAIQLTFNDWAWDHHPSWSPDGTEIVFGSNRSGSRQIWIMNADGSNQRPLTPSEYEAWDPVWVKYPDT